MNWTFHNVIKIEGNNGLKKSPHQTEYSKVNHLVSQCRTLLKFGCDSVYNNNENSNASTDNLVENPKRLWSQH